MQDLARRRFAIEKQSFKEAFLSFDSTEARNLRQYNNLPIRIVCDAISSFLPPPFPRNGRRHGSVPIQHDFSACNNRRATGAPYGYSEKRFPAFKPRAGEMVQWNCTH